VVRSTRIVTAAVSALWLSKASETSQIFSGYNREILFHRNYRPVITNAIMKIQIINGPNLNLLGIRETEIYGTVSFPDFLKKLKQVYPDIIFEYFQSNIEGDIINKIHETGFSYDGIVLNAGGYSHTSVAIADAISAVTSPVIEVHISNLYTREEYRHFSIIAAKCKGSVIGFGLDSYRLAIEGLIFGKRNEE